MIKKITNSNEAVKIANNLERKGVLQFRRQCNDPELHTAVVKNGLIVVDDELELTWDSFTYLYLLGYGDDYIPELLPCPFCSSKARHKKSRYFDSSIQRSVDWHAIYCPTCKVSQPIRTYYSWRESVDNWNRRRKEE